MRYTNFQEFYKNLVEKREKTGETEEFMNTLGISQKSTFNKGADYVVVERYNGGTILQAYRGDEPQNGDWAVMLPGKPMDFCSSMAEARKIIDATVKAVDASFAGEKPESLLARQDLEGTEKVQKAKDDVTLTCDRCGESWVVPRIRVPGNRTCSDCGGKLTEKVIKKGDASARASILADQGYTVSEIRSQLKSMDYDEYEISDALAYIAPFASKAVDVVERVEQMHRDGHFRMNVLQTLINEGYPERDIRAAIDECFGKTLNKTSVSADELRGNEILPDGRRITNADYRNGKVIVTFSDGSTKSVATDYIFDVVNKGAVETSGKELDEALKDAPNAETRMERKSLVETIKDAQLKRQKATIQARAKEASGKSFKETWKGLQGR
jgi:hypothetical protein